MQRGTSTDCASPSLALRSVVSPVRAMKYTINSALSIFPSPQQYPSSLPQSSPPVFPRIPLWFLRTHCVKFACRLGQLGNISPPRGGR